MVNEVHPMLQFGLHAKALPFALGVLLSFGSVGFAEAGQRFPTRDVVCVAGCGVGNRPPVVVQQVGEPVSTRPIYTVNTANISQPAYMIWCFDDGGCTGMASSPPHRGSVDISRSNDGRTLSLSHWSW